MHTDVSLIATLTAALSLGLGLGLVACLLRMPPLLGYLLAGVLLGPATPGFVANVELAQEMAEIGVILLMFGIGLHFSLDDLRSVYAVAVPGACLQILASITMGGLLALGWGWPIGEAIIFGLCLSVASTVVLLRVLEGRGKLDSPAGRIAVGWLVVEDLLMVLALVLLPAIADVFSDSAVQAAGASPIDIGISVGITLAKVAAFIALMVVVGRRLLPRMLWLVARTGSRELFTLCVVVVAVSLAFGAGILFDVSFALGAFAAGMVLRESEFSHRAADETLPFRDAFAVLFFVSVGMVFDPAILWQQPLQVLAVLAVIVIGKGLVAVTLVLALRRPLATALTVAASLAQIGEFSFILADLGVDLGLMGPQAKNLVLAGAVLSIALNPALFGIGELLAAGIYRLLPSLRPPLGPEDPLAELPASLDEQLITEQVVLVGYGRVGRQVYARLQARRVPVVVAERDRSLVEHLRAAGHPAVIGDATTPEVLIQAHVTRAALLVVTLRETVDIRRILDLARQLNPDLAVVLCTTTQAEAALLRQAQAGDVFLPEVELGRSMADRAIERLLERAGVAG